MHVRQRTCLFNGAVLHSVARVPEFCFEFCCFNMCTKYLGKTFLSLVIMAMRKINESSVILVAVVVVNSIA